MCGKSAVLGWCHLLSPVFIAFIRDPWWNEIFYVEEKKEDFLYLNISCTLRYHRVSKTSA